MNIEEQIKSQILSKKSDLRLDRFLNKALYDNNGYYYKKKPIGTKKDFITSPEICQIFGEIIGLYLYYFWKNKINSKFNFIELGPGNGTLFVDIVRSVAKKTNFLKNAKISFIEINKQLVKVQKKKFNKLYLNNISWDKNLNINSKYPLLIYSNEFFDCFPVRQFVLNKFWYEKYISYNIHDDNLIYKNKLVKNKKLLSLLANFQKQKIYECSFERNKYFENICKRIKKRGGIFLTIDYGYFTEPKNYTLQAVQNHKFSNVLENIGNQDISSHVNFGDFIKIVKKYDLKIEEFCTQREFLIKFGIVEREKNLTRLSNSEKISKGVDRLIDKNKMGNLFKFLVVSNLK